jgi:hypothetical protein
MCVYGICGNWALFYIDYASAGTHPQEADATDFTVLSLLKVWGEFCAIAIRFWGCDHGLDFMDDSSNPA